MLPVILTTPRLCIKALFSVPLQVNELDTSSATGKICWTNTENVFPNDIIVEAE